jgi:hypothetical protein
MVLELTVARQGINSVGRVTLKTELSWIRAGVLVALGAAALAMPRTAVAQAAPGPMHPVANSDASDDPTAVGDVTRTRRPPPRPATKYDLAGVWKFDQDESDDILEKLKEARQGSGGRDDGNGNNNPHTSNNGGIHMGGMGSPYPGTGSGGGNNGGGNPRSRGANGSPSSEISANNPEIEEYTTPAEKLTFVEKENEIDLSDDASRQRTYFTDDRRIAKPENQKPSEPRQFDAYWEDANLVAKEDLPHSVRVTREFQPQPGGRQLVEKITIETNHSNGYVEYQVAYDRVGEPPPPPPPSAPKPITSTTTAQAPAGGAPPITSTTTAPANGGAPPATVPNATQSAGPSDAPTLKRPTSPQ